MFRRTDRQTDRQTGCVSLPLWRRGTPCTVRDEWSNSDEKTTVANTTWRLSQLLFADIFTHTHPHTHSHSQQKSRSAAAVRWDDAVSRDGQSKRDWNRPNSNKQTTSTDAVIHATRRILLQQQQQHC